MDDRPRLRAAARRAGADDTVTALPHGYATMLSRIFGGSPDRDDPSTGVLLSGGRWQRLALARAFLRDQRDLPILDEPSSGLYAEAEHDLHGRRVTAQVPEGAWVVAVRGIVTQHHQPVGRHLTGRTSRPAPAHRPAAPHPPAPRAPA